mmetsp:Transcript_5263/g.12604  ORF Transcript_5263/g.12604 Transcript_5263/m.12604 type:complete len:210 (-) Transcript_5263:121-750(-)
MRHHLVLPVKVTVGTQEEELLGLTSSERSDPASNTRLVEFVLQSYVVVRIDFWPVFGQHIHSCAGILCWRQHVESICCGIENFLPPSSDIQEPVEVIFFPVHGLHLSSRAPSIRVSRPVARIGHHPGSPSSPTLDRKGLQQRPINQEGNQHECHQPVSVSFLLERCPQECEPARTCEVEQPKIVQVHLESAERHHQQNDQGAAKPHPSL